MNYNRMKKIFTVGVLMSVLAGCSNVEPEKEEIKEEKVVEEEPKKEVIDEKFIIRKTREDFRLKDWKGVVIRSETLHEEYPDTPEDKEAQELAAEAIENNKKDYDTGLMYSDLAGVGKNYGKLKMIVRIREIERKDLEEYEVIANADGDSNRLLKLRVDKGWMHLYGIGMDDLDLSELQEGDLITIYGNANGLDNFRKALDGEERPLPKVTVDMIETLD